MLCCISPLSQFVSLNVDTVHHCREIVENSAADKARKSAISASKTWFCCLSSSIYQCLPLECPELIDGFD